MQSKRVCIVPRGDLHELGVVPAGLAELVPQLRALAARQLLLLLRVQAPPLAVLQLTLQLADVVAGPKDKHRIHFRRYIDTIINSTKGK